MSILQWVVVALFALAQLAAFIWYYGRYVHDHHIRGDICQHCDYPPHGGTDSS